MWDGSVVGEEEGGVSQWVNAGVRFYSAWLVVRGLKWGMMGMGVVIVLFWIVDGAFWKEFGCDWCRYLPSYCIT